MVSVVANSIVLGNNLEIVESYKSLSASFETFDCTQNPEFFVSTSMVVIKNTSPVLLEIILLLNNPSLDVVFFPLENVLKLTRCHEILRESVIVRTVNFCLGV